jgi:hypothetical protein
MFHHMNHPSDETLLLAIDGELAARRLVRIDRHLAGCEECRRRWHEFERSIEEFSSACRDELAAQEPATAAFRARVQSSVIDLSTALERSWRARLADFLSVPRVAVAVAALAVVAVTAAVLGPRFAVQDLMVEAGALPVRSLTPGAIRIARADELCAGSIPVPRPVPAAIRQAVLRDYGMESVPAHEYELDYLITPELGGSADRLNLWPERYGARVWNARVKDELESLLPQLVCRGPIEHTTAQQDISAAWIAAFHN